jgi:Gpi18-like mannosyltransferase
MALEHRSFFHHLTPSQKKTGLLLLFAILGILLTPKIGFYWDTRSWVTWTRAIGEFGLREVYSHSDCNYLPGFLYVLQFFSLFNPPDNDFLAKIIVLKTIVFLFEVFVLRFIFIRTPKIPLWAMALLLINPALWFNSLIFAQVDGIHSGLCVMSIFYLHEKKPGKGLLSFILALFFKLQSILFLPIFGLLWAVLILKLPIQRSLRSIFPAVLLSFLLLLPFRLDEVWHVVTHSIGYFNRVSMNAYNIWYLISPSDPYEIKDTSDYLFHTTYRTLGTILFIASTGFIYWLAFYKRKIAHILQNIREMGMEKWGLLGAYSTLCFFFFFTQMHERYIHPAVLFGLVYSLHSRKWLGFILVSIAYPLNMDRIVRFFSLHDIIPNIEIVIAGIYLIALGIWTFNLLDLFIFKRQPGLSPLKSI